MEQIDNKTKKKEYEIIPIFSKDSNKIEKIIESAFLKYLKYNDYK